MRHLRRSLNHLRHGGTVDEHGIVETGSGAGKLGNHGPDASIQFDGAVRGYIHTGARYDLAVLHIAVKLGGQPRLDNEIGAGIIADDLQLR